MRVTQYEEDIREKDAQRSLPGWNFCTFFVLKEGLARGFESVGLVEDALVGYDELAVGLDSVIRDQSALGQQDSGSFLPFTDHLKHLAETARAALLKDYGSEPDSVDVDNIINLQSPATSSEQEADEIPLNASKKRYRELILANNISIFDFRCYMFARQLSLLLRMANASSSQDELLAKLREQRESSLQGVAARLPPPGPSEDAEDLALLADICRRTMEFVVSISNIMREDILASQLQAFASHFENEAQKPESDRITERVNENMVWSFVFSITEQILAQTSTKALPIPPSTLAPPSSAMTLDGQEPKAAIPEPKTMMHPARSSSLAMSPAPRDPQSPDSFPSVRRHSVPDHGVASSAFLKAGLEDLAARRAEVYLFSRNVLERAGKERGWSVGWVEYSLLHSSENGEMEDVPIDGEDLETPRTNASSMHHIEPSPRGITSKLLRTALDNSEDFYRLYETLTDKALRHFTVANHVKSVQACMADLAVLKYHLEDYGAAASYLYHLTRFYGGSGWTQVELSMLVMYVECLKQLQRKEEYVRIVLQLLSKVATVEKQKLSQKSPLNFGQLQPSLENATLKELYLEELLQITRSLPNEVRVPLQNFFGSVEVDGTPRYHSEEDSFFLQLRFRYLLPEPLKVERVKVKMSPVSRDGRDVWLVNEGPLGFKDGNVQISVESKAIIPGRYLVSHVSLFTSNIVFHYEHATTVDTTHDNRDAFFKCPRLLIYQRAEALGLKLFASRNMHLDRNRSLEIELSSGWNDITHAELHVRAATAGLRLQTSEAKVIYGLLEQYKKPEGGMLHLGVMPHNATAKLRIPFSLEHEVSEITIRLEISYTTEKGHYFFSATLSVSVMLPLGVNVQDAFKHKALFSKFTIASATSSPLRLLNTKLEDSEVFEAACSSTTCRPLVVFPRQPATMLYKISTRTSQSRRPSKSSRREGRTSLSLILQYTCLEEEIDVALRESLQRFLEQRDSQQYTRLVTPVILGELRKRLSPDDLERIAVLGEFSTLPLSDVRWRDEFAGLGRTVEQNQDVAEKLTDVLKDWQKSSITIPLPDTGATDPIFPGIRSIKIPVDVPSVTVVHTADLKLLETSSVPSTIAVMAFNEPIVAVLSIKWTRVWDTSLRPSDSPSEQQRDFEFYYEITGAVDTWLIGGRRKGHFTVPHRAGPVEYQRRLSFPVVLVPLREGYLPFPHVDIKPVLSHSESEADEGNEQSVTQRLVTCETDYKNSAEMIRVISDAVKTTVSLDASGPHGGAWLLERERRGQGAVVL